MYLWRYMYKYIKKVILLRALYVLQLHSYNLSKTGILRCFKLDLFNSFFTILNLVVQTKAHLDDFLLCSTPKIEK